jgi:ABC-type multidrug transport system fused ATPase/permease subunit
MLYISGMFRYGGAMNSVYDWLRRATYWLFRFDKHLRLYQVDFSKPWGKLYWDYRWLQAYFFATTLVENIYITILPVLVAIIIERGDFNGLVILAGSGVVIYAAYLVAHILNNHFILSVARGLVASAGRFFLSVDPVCHTTRDSGKIVAKINRAESGLIEFDSLLIHDLVSIPVNLLTIMVTLLVVNGMIGGIATVCILILATLNIIFRVLINNAYRQERIQRDDTAKSSILESLQQVGYVRSLFATPEQMKKIQQSHFESGVIFGLSWNISALVDLAIELLYVLMTLWIGWLVLVQVQQQSLTLATGVGLIGTVLSGSRGVLVIGSRIRRAMEYMYGIQDLFQFIRGFGKQTYPVLEVKELKSEGVNKLKSC